MNSAARINTSVYPPKILADYVGSYELGPGFILVVALEGSQLMTQPTTLLSKSAGVRRSRTDESLSLHAWSMRVNSTDEGCASTTSRFYPLP
jgi:hypothetical protein